MIFAEVFLERSINLEILHPIFQGHCVGQLTRISATLPKTHGAQFIFILESRIKYIKIESLYIAISPVYP
jgi:hypothetical protein